MYGVPQIHLNGANDSVYSRCNTCIALLSPLLNVCCRRDHASASKLFTRRWYSVSEYILFFLCTTICIIYAGFSLRSPHSPAFQLGRTFFGDGGRSLLLMYRCNSILKPAVLHLHYLPVLADCCALPALLPIPRTPQLDSKADIQGARGVVYSLTGICMILLLPLLNFCTV